MSINTNTITRNRTTGNFIFELYRNADYSKQLLLKGRLVKFNLWDSFNRIQTKHGKKDSFDAQTIGICVQTLITEKAILERYDLPDLTKLYIFWAESTGNPITEKYSI